MDVGSVPRSYIRKVLGPRDEILEAVLRTSLLQENIPPIQVDDNAGRILQILTSLHRPMFAIEIGSLFGYSTICIARGLPEGAKLAAIEMSESLAASTRRNVQAAKLDSKVDVINADAVSYIPTIRDNSVDMVFIDADKKSYPEYLKVVYPKLKRGGLLIADDAFANADFTMFSEGADNAKELEGIHKYNCAVAKSPKLVSAFIGTETGMLISVKQ